MPYDMDRRNPFDLTLWLVVFLGVGVFGSHVGYRHGIAAGASAWLISMVGFVAYHQWLARRDVRKSRASNVAELHASLLGRVLSRKQAQRWQADANVTRELREEWQRYRKGISRWEPYIRDLFDLHAADFRLPAWEDDELLTALLREELVAPITNLTLDRLAKDEVVFCTFCSYYLDDLRSKTAHEDAALGKSPADNEGVRALQRLHERVERFLGGRQRDAFSVRAVDRGRVAMFVAELQAEFGNQLTDDPAMARYLREVGLRVD